MRKDRSYSRAPVQRPDFFELIPIPRPIVAHHPDWHSDIDRHLVFEAAHNQAKSKTIVQFDDIAAQFLRFIVLNMLIFGRCFEQALRIDPNLIVESQNTKDFCELIIIPQQHLVGFVGNTHSCLRISVIADCYYTKILGIFLKNGRTNV